MSIRMNVLIFIAMLMLCCKVSGFHMKSYSRSPFKPTFIMKAVGGRAGKQLSPECEAALAFYKKSGTSNRYTTEELAVQFNLLAKVLDDQSSALTAVKNFPAVLTTDANRVSDNFDVYAEKWGVEKAQGVVVRNPGLLAVATRGYGSAEVAGDETVVMSYVINFTRPAGKPLLALLFIALLWKPVVVPYLLQQ